MMGLKLENWLCIAFWILTEKSIELLYSDRSRSVCSLNHQHFSRSWVISLLILFWVRNDVNIPCKKWLIDNIFINLLNKNMSSHIIPSQTFCWKAQRFSRVMKIVVQLAIRNEMRWWYWIICQLKLISTLSDDPNNPGYIDNNQFAES